MKYEAASNIEIAIYALVFLFYAISSIVKWVKKITGSAAQTRKGSNTNQYPTPTYNKPKSIFEELLNPQPTTSSQEQTFDETEFDTETEYQNPKERKAVKQYETLESTDLEEELTEQVENNKFFSYETATVNDAKEKDATEQLKSKKEEAPIDDDDFGTIDITKAILYSEILKRPAY